MASAPSSSGPVEAPVKMFTLNFCPRRWASVILRASAMGTAFGYPDPVKPLIPICDPGWIRAAASSPLITRCAKTGFNTLSPAELEAIDTSFSRSGKAAHPYLRSRLDQGCSFFPAHHALRQNRIQYSVACRTGSHRYFFLKPRKREISEMCGLGRAHRYSQHLPRWQCFDGSHAEPCRTVRCVTPVRIYLKYHCP